MKLKHLSTYLSIFLSICFLIFSFPSYANHRHIDKKNTLLIINSYNENSPWIRALVTPITLYVAKDDDVHAEIFSLNNVCITDSASYFRMKEDLFETYENRKPSYLVIIGNMGFTLRDAIKEQWGDIPILLITRDMTMAPLEHYFSGFDKPLMEQAFPSIAELRPQYNFTAVYMPDFYKQTIDMMSDMIPNMDELIFFSDGIFINRYLSRDIEYYLMEEYPNVKYRWVQATEEYPDELQKYFVNPMPNTGLLMSSWAYAKTNSHGYSMNVFGDLNLMYSSVNPIFSLRESYINLGSIGGVYPDLAKVQAHTIEILSQLVNGESMRDIPFYINRKDSYTKINYELLEEYDISEKKCPEDTIFIGRPLTYWEKYKWQMLASIAGLVILILLFLYRYNTQRNQIAMLSRHKRFVESMPVPYSKAKVIYNDEGKIINIKYSINNDAFQHLLEDNAYNVEPYLLFPNDFIAEKTAEMIKTKRNVSFLYHFDKNDKYYIFTLCRVGSLKGDNTDIVDEIDIFAIDVTTRQKAEVELKRTTEKLDRTLNVAKLIPWEWNLTNDQLMFDALSLYHRSGFNPGDKGKSPIANKKTLQGYEFISMVHPDDRKILLKLREDLLAGITKDFYEQYRIMVARDGKEVEEWVEINGEVSDVSPEGIPSGVTGSLLIITDRKRQEMELVEAKEKANESDKMKSAFLANMSHEIRTPLNAIVGFSGLLAESDDKKQRKEFADIISKNNDVLLSVISDVLDLAKIESNTLEMNFSTLNLNAMISALAETMQPRMKPGVRLNVVVGAQNCFIRTDGNRLSQILNNLLSNAIKFTTKGNVTFGYDIVDNKEIYFYVKDTGIGVAKENQARLFTRFGKLDNFEQGNGLGLAIAKSLVERLGGRIGMSSRGEGKGCTFWFTIKYEEVEGEPADDNALPIDLAQALEYVRAESHSDVISDMVKTTLDNIGSTKSLPIELPIHDEADADDDKKSDDAKPAPLQPKSEPEKNGKVILAAEDIEGNYLLLKHYIPDEFTIIHAWNGREAVDLYLEHHPDLILMDINMPVVNGYEATKEIRAIDKQVPIIAVTAYAYASDRKRILQSGFNDYVSKPVTRNDLLDAISRYLK